MAHNRFFLHQGNGVVVPVKPVTQRGSRFPLFKVLDFGQCFVKSRGNVLGEMVTETCKRDKDKKCGSLFFEWKALYEKEACEKEKNQHACPARCDKNKICQGQDKDENPENSVSMRIHRPMHSPEGKNGHKITMGDMVNDGITVFLGRDERERHCTGDKEQHNTAGNKGIFCSSASRLVAGKKRNDNRVKKELTVFFQGMGSLGQVNWCIKEANDKEEE